MYTLVDRYGELYLREPQMVEMCPRQGLELTPEDIDHAMTEGRRAAGGPYALLVNRKNDYSLTLPASLKVGDDPNLIAFAYLVHSDHSRAIAEYNVRMARRARCPMQVFTSRPAALEWLRQHIERWKAELAEPSSGGNHVQ